MALHATESETLNPAQTDALAHAVPLDGEPLHKPQEASGTFDLAWLLTTKLEPALAYYVYVNWALRHRSQGARDQHWKSLPRKLRRRAEWQFRWRKKIRQEIRQELAAEHQ